ncbi:zinc finger protein 40 isoform X10 [Lepidochelys kempii]|uniref:zinc finger protein 40 isoform X10 n=1 Tax=Lepidochelys kempii TaxID=8472 RepID=UPI003C6F39C8
MPRTKQIHPRNLRDKIEEAQKELNETEDQQKVAQAQSTHGSVEFWGSEFEAGTRGTSDTVKGVKRKKIVTENHLKKIPKSPLRNPPQAKHKQNVEESSSSKILPDASEHLQAKNQLPVQNGKQCVKQNGETHSNKVTDETVTSETSMQTNLSLLRKSLDLNKWTAEDCDTSQLNLPEKKPLSNSLSSKSKTDNNECITFVDCSTSSSGTSTAFDVLLKAMEPELNILAQECPPCGMQIEKVRPNKTTSASSSLTSNTMSVQNHFSLSQQEFVAGSHYYPSHNAHAVTSGKSEQAQTQSISHSQEQFIAKTGQQNQQIVVCPGFTRSLVRQQGQENPKLQQIYSIAVTSSVVHPPSSTVTQVFPQNQLVASSSSSLSINPSHSTHLPVAPLYNSAQIASVVHHGVEQICNLLKDQKPKKLGKYVCEYCNRACAKPSVLQKHIRSHTGERPYPCVTCGFSFKTKSNLYKHKKSHAHAIKLGLVLQPDSGGLFLSHESDKALSIHSDVEESCESEDEGTADERQDDQGSLELDPAQIMKIISNSETLRKGSPIPLSNPNYIIGDSSLHDTEPQVRAALPKVVVHPVNVSPLRADSPEVTDSTPELAAAQRQGDFKVTNIKSNVTHMVSFKETDGKHHQKIEMGSLEEQLGSAVGTVHAQLQRQQATDCSQEQGKCLLSPRSLGSTDSGYFSRSESADQTMSSPTPFVRGLPISEKDPNKNLPSVPRISATVASVVQTVCAEKHLLLSGQMRPPMATKTLEERISKLISDNEAVVDDKQLDSVKPRRTSLSRRGSIDSPKSYIFKDSFQFDLKPMGRRTSSSSDIPKSPFTPTEKSKQVFLLSVPSLDCLPITRSNSMPTTSYSAVPANLIPPPHPIRGSQSFDDKIGSSYDDVFVSGPVTPLHQGGHTRTLVRQTAIEDSSTNESHSLGPARSVEESYHGCNLSSELSLPRSKSLAQVSNLEKVKKSHPGRGTMFECETCRNRYRKLENFENHKKFYCSELHGPKTKAAIREPEHKIVPSTTQPQILHYRVASSTGVWEQTPQIRKRRKMKSVGDDDEPQQNDTGIPSKSTEGQSKPGEFPSISKPNATIVGSQQHGSILLQRSQVQLVARGTEQTTEPKISPLMKKQTSSVAQEKVELKRQGTGISVIQHTNSLSRPSSFEKSESFERVSPVSFQEVNKAEKHHSLNTVVIQEERHSHLNTSQHHQSVSAEAPRVELQESQIVSNERNAVMHPLKLVRQHNIQVPEILVTEEPDRDQENQFSDQEKTEKFNWPQRSETLSKLPTEKLPPKKKRIRLAEIEHSSAESSFDSTLSRSLSQESSLSHASSFSASFDKEDISKTECASKIDLNKASEFLTIPAGSNTLGVPGPPCREMRRAASEQINCTQPSMEVVDYRSKSFDCGNMSSSKPTPLVEISSPKLSSGCGVTGHVPLLERRRGPLVRQISLNIAPENHLPQVKSSSSFQIAHATDMSTVPFHRLKTSSRTSVEFPSSSQHSQPYSKPLHESQSITQNCNPLSLPSVQQPLGPVLHNQGQQPLTQHSQTSLKVLAPGEQADTNTFSCQSVEKEYYFAPKYQLQVKALHVSTSYSSKPITTAFPIHTLPSQISVDQSGTSLSVPTKLADSMSNLYSMPPQKHIPPENSSGKIYQIPPFVVPVRVHSNVPSYGFATVTPLPQILVTQDQVNQSVCKTNVVTVPILEGKTPLPKLHRDHQRVLPNPQSASIFDHSFSETGSRNSPLSSSLNIIQKLPVSGLFPQQEATASSKRMLSPANSLDIAMEKHQKRVKDESGAACTTDARSMYPLNIRANDPNRQKKPVLVRQICTTEPLEGLLLEPEVIPQYEKSSKDSHSPDVLLADQHSSESVKTGVSETIKESPEFENLTSSAPPSFEVKKPSEPSAVNNQTSLLKALSNSQERWSPRINNEDTNFNTQGQANSGTTLSVANAGDTQRLSFPSLKTSTNFTWCYLLKRKPLHLLQNDQKTSAYSTWTISLNNPNPLGLSTKVALSLLNSKQKAEKPLYTQAITTHARSDVLVYSSKWRNSLTKVLKRALNKKKMTPSEFSNKENSETSTEHDKENSFTKTEPRRVKIFDGGYKSNEEYVYIRGRGRGKYICEECGIRCKKPSMLKKHIRTHTDVRPYHCNYCNFSFKTKGNLTKHMKSKAHSKKCMDLGVSVGLIDDQDGEEYGEKQRFGCDRSGFDVEDSDGPEDDDNDNEDDDEDSQAESVLSTTPSVTASPQHHPSRNILQETTSADEDIRITDCFAGVHTDSMDGLPKALLTKMTVLSTVQSDCRNSRSPIAITHQEAKEEKIQDKETSIEPTISPGPSPRSPCHQMSVDYPDTAEALGSSATPTTVVSKSTAPVRLPSPPVDQSTQTTMVVPSAASPYPDIQEEKLHATELTAPLTHLFSHLPLHSQQQAKTPYGMVPVGGIHVVPAGLATYSTFVPIQAGPVQLTIPAVSVIHRTTSALGDTARAVSATANPLGVAEVNSVVPCIPIGQINGPGVQSLTAPSLQPLPPLGMETVNILGLTNTNIAPQIHPSGLTLNAVGLQVLTANTSPQSNPSPHTHIPGLQILNIALPTLIPSVSPVTTDGQGVPETPASSNKACEIHQERTPVSFPAADSNPITSALSPQAAPTVQWYNIKKVAEPFPSKEYERLDGPGKTDTEKADPVNHVKPKCDVISIQVKRASTSEPILKVNSEVLTKSPVHQTLSPKRQVHRPAGLSRRQNTVQFSDGSSDDEDRLVIAT